MDARRFMVLAVAMLMSVACGSSDPTGSDSAGAGGSAGVGGTTAPGSGGDATGGASAGGASGSCVRARLLWFEDFETGDYSRWTSETYGGTWKDDETDCQSNGFSTEQAVSGTHSHKSEITCAFTESHRGYGGLQFSGDNVVPAYTNSGTGIDAPFGVVNTFYSYLDTPHVYGGGEVSWFSFWTVNHSCDWSEEVLTLGLEEPTHRLAAAHYQPNGGTRTFADSAPGFPNAEWARVTIYVNYYDGVMHIWQNGQDVSHVTFSRSANTICQWHWGAYASGDNSDVTLYEDDNFIYKLEEPWTDFSREPHLGGSVPVCE